MSYSLIALAEPTPREIRIRKRYEFEDSKDEVRWRAWWDWDSTGRIMGVELVSYPVLKLTPATRHGDKHADHHGEWQLSTLKRWVSNDGGQAWAKPTQQLALDSLLIRHKRWASRLYQDVSRFRATLAAINCLFPEHGEEAKALLEMVRGGTAL